MESVGAPAGNRSAPTSAAAWPTDSIAARRSPPSPSTTISAPSTRTCSCRPSYSHGGVPHPPGGWVSAISLSGLRAGATTSAAIRCSAKRVERKESESGSRLIASQPLSAEPVEQRLRPAVQDGVEDDEQEDQRRDGAAER